MKPYRDIQATADAPDPAVSRRVFLAAGAGAAVCVIAPSARATPAEMEAAIRAFTGGAAIAPVGVKVDIPVLLESGNSVPVTISVDSPMTPESHVRAIAVFNERNPQPHVGVFHLTPRSGRAVVSTRIRLGDSQKVVAVAQMSDGAFRSGEIEVIVTLPACVEGA
jgi:sulfur-oxidizing protein SoxY